MARFDHLKAYEPKKEWLLHDSQLHGIGHMTRVLILQELISDDLQAEGKHLNREALRWAAVTHDLRRLDDGLDPLHGERAAQWVLEHLRGQISSETLQTVFYLNRWHSVEDYMIPEITSELSVLKDSDALDRVRLDDLDQSYLRLQISSSLKKVAYALWSSTQASDTSSIPFDVMRTGVANNWNN